jgi:hypothetical protein
VAVIWNDLWQVQVPLIEKVLRTVLVYGGLVVLLRVAGKRDLAQLNSFDLVVLLLLANVVQKAVIGSDNSLAGGLLGAAVLVAVNAGVVRSANRYPRLLRLFEGSPTTLVQDGQLAPGALRRLGLRHGDVVAACRRQGADDISEIKQAATVTGADPDSFATEMWSGVDASSNLALSGLPVTLICLCDAEPISDDAERFLYWNHPELLVGPTVSPNPRYRAPAEVLASTPAPPAPALGPRTRSSRSRNGTTTLRGIRAWTKRHGLEAGLAPERIEGLVLALCELVSNSIEHGAGHGTLSWWTRPGRVVAQIYDPGHMSTTTPGLRRPALLSVRARGVWMARQLCDLLHLWITVDGTHARLEIGA